ncbi:hypothetical protein LJR296_008008 [Cupriavidus necator]|uniref:hypothetical protein n=1 Tax=Cupriavidus necator TaxID=106590 RepID=UPI003ECE6756
MNECKQAGTQETGRGALILYALGVLIGLGGVIYFCIEETPLGWIIAMIGGLIMVILVLFARAHDD